MSSMYAGMASSALSSIMSGLWGKYFADRQWSQQKKVLNNQIQWRVGDMRAAGINPILAVSGMGGSAGSVPMGHGMPVESIAGEAAKFQSAKQMSELLELEKALKRDERELLWAQRDESHKRAHYYGSSTRLNLQTEEMNRAGVASAAAAESLLSQYPWIKKAGIILRELGPAIPHMGLGYYGQRVPETWSHEEMDKGEGWMTRTKRSGKRRKSR